MRILEGVVDTQNLVRPDMAILGKLLGLLKTSLKPGNAKYKFLQIIRCRFYSATSCPNFIKIEWEKSLWGVLDQKRESKKW